MGQLVKQRLLIVLEGPMVVVGRADSRLERHLEN